MQLIDFDYCLPENLIAQKPADRREDSKMLVLHASTGTCEIRKFPDIATFLQKGDCIVVNNSKVIRARIFGIKKGTGARIEILLVKELDKAHKRWECLAKPGKRLKPGTEIELLRRESDLASGISATVESLYEDGTYGIKFLSEHGLDAILAETGHIPLPPYIRRKDADADHDRYQTVYASDPGSVAAPTAGLHFSKEILAEFAGIGIGKAELTLHVGPGTFLPVSNENIAEHKMHSESFSLNEKNAEIINSTKKSGGRILAVGTTTVRVLETCADENGHVSARQGETDIFLRPPYRPRVPDMLLTNFHLPKSTLLMLVSCFADREKVLAAYELAKSADFRFYSYGDCMLVTR